MVGKRVQEQHIAVFGESGSGKTVLVSSFYGGALERSSQKESHFALISDNTGLGTRLRQNYLGMKNSAKAPQATRFAATQYAFTVTPKVARSGATAKKTSIDALRLVWHDYPGEWFEDDPSSDEEAARRVDTFRALLRSDVAVLLIDGQKLLDNEGAEEAYLKSLFWGMRDGIRGIKDDLLTDGELLDKFPRIWLIALSKADLHPEMKAPAFRDLVVEKAAVEVEDLRETLASLVQRPEALSLGEDYLVLSSAKFEPGRILLTEGFGLNLLLPAASILPVERMVAWSEWMKLPWRAVKPLLNSAEALSLLIAASGPVAKLIGKVPKVGPLLAGFALPAVTALIEAGKPKLEELHRQAIAKHDFLTAILTQFRLDLEDGIERDLFVKSPR
ncbi:TRAFAC clade GTPase domain-containing protein [Pseudactinotalea terrae]|uniref:TRAFAC clade GTPase domain-containing protein n=1 Tax=Pseudactinotalea terrae TaxID=1743262 RepID=UPI0012E2787B|nr:ATP/GTP-binding protein [Pseudactinotalea terrae]